MMKENDMKSQEHTIAVVEPAIDGDSTLEYARQAVERGGSASVIVLLGKESVAGIAAFSEAEDLTFADGREIYIDRLARSYNEMLSGSEQLTFVADGPEVDRLVFDRASSEDATTVVVPQRLVNRRRWKASVARSQVPVLIAPQAA
jgi:hypothetical protein